MRVSFCDIVYIQYLNLNGAIPLTAMSAILLHAVYRFATSQTEKFPDIPTQFFHNEIQ